MKCTRQFLHSRAIIFFFLNCVPFGCHLLEKNYNISLRSLAFLFQRKSLKEIIFTVGFNFHGIMGNKSRRIINFGLLVIFERHLQTGIGFHVSPTCLSRRNIKGNVMVTTTVDGTYVRHVPA